LKNQELVPTELTIKTGCKKLKIIDIIVQALKAGHLAKVSNGYR